MDALPTHTGVDIHSPFPVDLLVEHKQDIDSHSLFAPTRHTSIFKNLYQKEKGKAFIFMSASAPPFFLYL